MAFANHSLITEFSGFATLSVNQFFLLAPSLLIFCPTPECQNHSSLLLPGFWTKDEARSAEGGVREDEGVRPTVEEQAPVHCRFQGGYHNIIRQQTRNNRQQTTDNRHNTQHTTDSR